MQLAQNKQEEQTYKTKFSFTRCDGDQGSLPPHIDFSHFYVVLTEKSDFKIEYLPYNLDGI